MMGDQRENKVEKWTEGWRRDGKMMQRESENEGSCLHKGQKMYEQPPNSTGSQTCRMTK